MAAKARWIFIYCFLKERIERSLSLFYIALLVLFVERYFNDYIKYQNAVLRYLR